MSPSEVAVSIGLNASDIAWPVVLALCIAFMVMPFVFLLVAVILPDETLEVPDDAPD